MPRTYYHNLTKGWFNETDLCDAIENCNKGDVIKFSVGGSALVMDLLREDLAFECENEFESEREKFLDYFEEFHGEKFNE